MVSNLLPDFYYTLCLLKEFTLVSHREGYWSHKSVIWVRGYVLFDKYQLSVICATVWPQDITDYAVLYRDNITRNIIPFDVTCMLPTACEKNSLVGMNDPFVGCLPKRWLNLKWWNIPALLYKYDIPSTVTSIIIYRVTDNHVRNRTDYRDLS